MSIAELRSALGKSEKRQSDLSAQNRELRKRNRELREQNAALVSDLKTLRSEFTAFREEVKKLLGHVPKSKHLMDEGQLSLFGEPDTSVPPPDDLPDLTDVDLDDDEDDPGKNKRKPRKRAKKTDKSLLPREVVRYELTEAERVCPDTGVKLVPIGEQVTEELDYVGAQLRLIEHRRVIYGPPPEVAEERKSGRSHRSQLRHRSRRLMAAWRARCCSRT